MRSSACSTASPRRLTAIRPTISSGCRATGKTRSGCASRSRLPVSRATNSSVSIEESQLVIRGRQQDDKTRQYLHRGIAARQFQRTFVLADGMEVMGADLKNGLLSIDLARPEPERVVKTISISEQE